MDRMLSRQKYDMNHYSFPVSRIGRLMTLSQIPVIAGDSWEINMNSVFRLSPLRRNLSIDAMVDVFAFYVPYRHIWPEFKDFVLDGYDETLTWPTGASSTNSPGYLGVTRDGWNGATIPIWMTAGYNRIWNRYFRNPTDDNELADTDLVSGVNGNLYGQLCAYPKAIWNTGVDPDGKPTASDREVDVTANKLDILDLAKVQGQYKTEVQREYFGQRYDDILKEAFGSGVNTDADERPTLVRRQTSWLSGYDVDGTGDSTLGSYAGKGMAKIEFQMPRRYFPEHGTLWIMGLVRFPPIHSFEVHYLTKKPNPTYLEISGDPELYAREEPIELEIQDLFGNTSSTNSLGLMPYGQWYRTQPNFVHSRITEQSGFPFITQQPTDYDSAVYHDDDDYGGTFQTDFLGHWQAQAALTSSVTRVVPGATRSIFAGT